MQNSKNAFSLVEILVASVILSITVFGVYKLIGENNKIINNSDNYTQIDYIFPNLTECINHIGFTNFKSITTSSYDFNFGATGTGCYTGSSKVIINNIEYRLSGKITNSGSEFIDWNLNIEAEGVGKRSQSFRQIQ
ncbi:MAG: prepilin-type N-terminal cleavage/methylation domain-containing protein [Candidatus Gracilibacteria bacterium]|nr:prepilin-type N-terminal cleavage/methylation domain-containing protein [Candidatus Gracilibacteria bacterium]